MDYLPICLDLRERACLVVGGGEVATRKVELLHRAGAKVRVVALEVSEALQAFSKRARARTRVLRKGYASSDLDGVAVVIAATDRSDVNAQVAADARARGLPVNVVDEPALCTFIMPALVDRSPVLVAISTAGAAPALARLTRTRVEAVLPARLGELAAFARRHRPAVRRAFSDQSQRRRFWDEVLTGPIGQLVLAGQTRAAQSALKAALASRAAPGRAEVTLLSVGDGDPDTLPLSAVRALGRTDLVLHESTIPDAVLERARRDAHRIDIGKSGASKGKGWTTAKLVRTAGEAARQGRPVCIVLAGDPFAAGPTDAWRRLAGGGTPVVILRSGPPQLRVPR